MNVKIFWPTRLAIELLVTAVLAVALHACGNAQPPPQPTPTPVPPTATPAATQNSSPTPVVPAQMQLSQYTHQTNRFSINYPTTWQSFDRPDGVIFIEPGDNAGYSVVFSDVGQSYSNQELNQYLVTFVAQNFAGEGSGFKAITQEQQPGGQVMAQFASKDPNLGQAISEVRVFQKDTVVFVLHFSTTEAQWGASYNGLQKLVSSFTPLDTSPRATPQPTDEPPVWELIGPESKEFGFLYATDWQILEQSQNTVSVARPNVNMVFTASNFAWPNIANPAAAKEAAQAHVEALSEEYDNVQSLPPTEFPLDTATGATIDFFYTRDDGTPIAGSVITAAHQGKMHKIVFTAPAKPVEVYDAALQWFNPMYKSFKFLSPEDFVDEEALE